MTLKNVFGVPLRPSLFNFTFNIPALVVSESNCFIYRHHRLERLLKSQLKIESGSYSECISLDWWYGTGLEIDCAKNRGASSNVLSALRSPYQVLLDSVKWRACYSRGEPSPHDVNLLFSYVHMFDLPVTDLIPPLVCVRSSMVMSVRPSLEQDDC